MADQRWAVVGGGMLGLTLALRLRQAGHEVTIYENASTIGGLASAWSIGDVVWDRHYHVILLSDSHVRAVLAELGIEDEIEWMETRTGCYAGGELYSVSNTIEFLKFPPLRMIDKVRLGWTIFYGSRIKNWKRLEQIEVDRWLARHSGRRTFEEFWRPLLRAKLGDTHRRASASFIWATIQRLYAARRTGLKKEMFGYVRGGYARILERFGDHLESLGVRIELDSGAEAVSRGDDGIAVTVGGTEHSFDRVVVTTAAPIAAQIIQGLPDAERSRLEGVEYLGIVCPSALLEHPLRGFYVTNITDEGFPFTGVIEMSALVRPEHLGGQGLVYLPKYTTGSDPAVAWSDDEVEREFLGGLGRMYPEVEPSAVKAFRVSRVRYVLPVPSIGYSTRVPAIESGVPGVFTVSSAQIVNGTLNVNETIELAERAIPVLLGRAPAATQSRIGGGPG